jgi:hypothetical protein
MRKKFIMRKIAYILILVGLFSCDRKNTWECEGDCYNGYGIKIFRDGGIEKGNWKDGELFGKGYQFFGETSEFQGDSYEGEFLNGYHGNGKYIWTNGSYYKGEWKNRKPHGNGKLVFGVKTDFPDEYYDGEWNQGIWEGFGKYKWADGSFYEGEWKSNEQHGKGLYTFPNGEQLESEWYKGYCRELSIIKYGEDGASFIALIDEISRPYHNITQNFLDEIKNVLQESIKNDTYKFDIAKLRTLRDSALIKSHHTINKLDEVQEYDEKIKYKSIYLSNMKFEVELLNEFDLWFELMQKDGESEKLEQVNNSIIEKLMTMEKNQKELEKIRSKFERKHI